MGVAVPQSEARGKASPVLLGAGILLAVAAAIAAPSGELLPGPQTSLQVALAAIALGAVFLVGIRLPVQSFYGVFLLTVADGAIRKWVYNDIVVYLLKDFLLLGVYAAVLPRLSRERLTRPWWLIAPLAALLLLSVVYVLRSPSLSLAAVGLRSYFIYFPLIWVAPAIVDRKSRATKLLVMMAAVGVAEALFASIQSLAGPGVLNKLVSGALPGIITVAGEPYLRPTGTFMQTADLSYVLVLALIAAVALLAWASSRRYQILAGAAIFASVGSIAVTAARTLLVSGALVIGGSVLNLAYRRRLVLAALVPVVAAFGLLSAVQGIPYLKRHAVPTVRSWLVHPQRLLPLAEFNKLTPVTLYDGNQHITVRIDKANLNAGAGHTGRVTIDAYTPDRREVLVKVSAATLREAAKLAEGGKVVGGKHVPRGKHVTLSAAGFLLTPTIGTSGFVSRATDINTAASPDSGSLWSKRLAPLGRLFTHPWLLGHGTGTMTLGAQYVSPSTKLAAESSYVKAEYELGLPGFVVFAWFVLAVVFVSFRAFRASTGWAHACSTVALAATVIASLWMLLTFTLDTPVVAEAYFAFVGLAVASALGWSRGDSGETGPVRA